MILPPICPMTGEIVDRAGMVHPSFWQKLSFIDGMLCHTCGTTVSLLDDDGNAGHEEEAQRQALCGHCLSHPPAYDAHRAPLAYDIASKPLILRFKHHDQHHLMTSFLPWLSAAYERAGWQSDLIIPVPLHYGRLLKRRYNQAAILAQYLSKSLDIPWAHDALKRHKATPTQGHKNFRQRQENVKNAFSVSEAARPRLEGRNILLVDDVYTTGATVNSCAKILKDAGAAHVNVLTLARVIKD